MYEHRFYRAWTESGDLEGFELKMGQSDLFITCPKGMRDIAEKALSSVRQTLQETIYFNDCFLWSLRPLSVPGHLPPVIQTMLDASTEWNVGPMASVAGAVAEFVGRELRRAGAESVIVENGGDIYCHAPRLLKFALYAGEESPFADKLAFEVDGREGVGVCTSSGRVGHSLSFGNADAVVVIAQSTAWADAAATAIANEIKGPADVDDQLHKLRGRPGVKGVILCCGDRLGAFGDLELSRR